MSRNLLQNCVGLWSPSLGPSGYTLLDRSGRGNHGTLTNMDSSDWVASPGGWALDFDGTNDEIVINNGILGGATDLTISYWVRKTSAVVDSTVGSRTTATAGVWLQYYSDGNVYFSIRNGGLDNISAAVTLTGSWMHILGSRTGSTGRIYVDGREIASGTLAPTVPSLTTFRIGALGTGGFFTTGQHDDVGVWRRGLTSTEIWQIYQLGRGGLGRLAIQGQPRHAYKTGAAGNKLWLNVSGTWKQTTPWIKVGGVWKQANPKIKVSGTWR